MERQTTSEEIRDVIDYLSGIPSDEWCAGAEVGTSVFSMIDKTYKPTFCYLGHVNLNPQSPWVLNENKKEVKLRRVPEWIQCGINDEMAQPLSHRLNILASKLLGASLITSNDSSLNPKSSVINVLERMYKIVLSQETSPVEFDHSIQTT